MGKVVKFLLSLVVAAGVSFSAAAEDLDDAKAYTQSVIDDAIVSIFNDKNKAMDSQIPPFRRALLKNFNFDFIANFVLGVHARGITAAQKNAFIDAFSELNVYGYAKKFVSYQNQKIEVTDATPSKKEGELFVGSKVLAATPGEKDTDVVWRLQKSGDGYKIIDIVIEGVSMAMSFRNEYAPILKAASDEGKVPVEELTRRLSGKLADLKAGK
jgi:phospholipid transport system substrate-binding protein